MWILILLLALASLLLAWTMFVYFDLLWLIGLFRSAREPLAIDRWPLVSIVVPCLQEERDLPAKLANLRALTYPGELEVVFVDGGSVDRTVELIEAAAQDSTWIRLVRVPLAGKVHQINAALPATRGEVIAVSDVDALLEPRALEHLVRELLAGTDVGVAGAYCRPSVDALGLDRYWWDSQNRGRFIEADAGCSSIVIAPCYAFRRELLSRLPDDVVADDIYVAFHAATLGLRVAYSRDAQAVETRNPANLRAFLPHKFRKSNAFLRETLRFLYRLPEMPGLFKVIFLTRLAQQLLLPWALLAWVLLAGALLTLHPIQRLDVVGFFAGGLLLLLVITSLVFSTVRLPGPSPRRGVLLLFPGYFLANLVMLATSLSYPFYRQGSSYARLPSRPSAPPATPAPVPVAEARS